jgi:hypothetical protein
MSRECLVTSLGMPGIFERLHAKMSALAWRKSTSTTSYFGSRVELTLNALPSAAAVSRGTSFGLFGSLEAARVLGKGVKVLVDQLLQGHDERLVKRQCLSVLHALDIGVERMLDRRAHGDDALSSRYLHLEVRVVRDHHELGTARSPKDGVVRAPEPHHLEGERFLAEIVRRAEPNRQIDLPGATPWNDVMLGRSWSNPIPISCTVWA